jgi:hypothetical protein
MDSSTAQRRDWNWEKDGALDGMYAETRTVTPKDGPSKGQEKVIFDFEVDDDEIVSVWSTTVIASKLARELAVRGKSDFEPGERFTISPTGWKESGVGNSYRDFEIGFEHAAPKKTTAELLGAGEIEQPPPLDDDEVEQNTAELAEKKVDYDDDLPF